MKNKEFFKYCPECNAKQFYTRIDHYNAAVRLNRICRKCSNNKEENNGYLGSYNDISYSWFNKIESQAKGRDLDFNLSIEFLWDLYLSQNKKCNLSNIPISFSKKATGNTASIDRIDSSKGYLEDNVQLVYSKINMMKQAYTQEEFIYLCNQVAKTNV